MLQRRTARGFTTDVARYGPDVLRHGSRILLIDLKRSDLHIDHRGLNLRVTHQLHQGRQADAGAHHI